MPETPVYRMEHIRKAYGQRQVLDVEQLDIRRGEILGLVGPSGSGKSTLLRLLNFLEPFDSGVLNFEDTRLEAGQSVPLEARRRVTTVFQRPMLLERSVWDNVAFGLKLRARRNGHIHQPVEKALQMVGMAHLARQSARTLSGGEAQRVALARALVLQPEVLLLDEPTANLDPANGGLIESVVRQLNAEQGVTIILVTHNIFQAKRLAQRAALLYDGRLIEVAEADKFFSDPQDERTKAFVKGEMIY